MASRPLTEHERAVLLRLLSVPLDGVDRLREQAVVARAATSPPTGLDLDVPPSAPVAGRPDGVLPVTAEVVDESGRYTGELLVWVRDGRLRSLEYAWVTDEPPTGLPPLWSIRVSGGD